MSVVHGREIAEQRGRHLSALARELEARGLVSRLAGPDESLLAVHAPRTRRSLMAVATPTGEGWSYLWPGGGIADVSRVHEVADRIARLLA